MRTLLVDNYDSYTYNLFQLIARVQGAEPVVMRNDEVDDLELSCFDNIVISPGPGDPRNSRDFGLSARILAEATVPVLGVCLGHQGIAAAARADLGPAPAPRHGHLARIRHTGTDLFDGLPQQFTAVRYHSLAVREPLPASLEALAWAEDGVLMALRHRTRPLWGVQFHPESILTQYGETLIANFQRLTERHHLPLTRTTLEPARPAPSTAPTARGYRLHKRILPVEVDAESAFATWFAGAPYAFWLDSSRTDGGQARFSFLGAGGGPLGEFVRYDVQAGTLHIERRGEPATLVAGDIFDYLSAQLAERRIDDPCLPFDFTCGYVGYFGYELKAGCGSVARHRAATPDASWLFADRLVVVDHQERTTYLLSLAEDTPAGNAAAVNWINHHAPMLAQRRQTSDRKPTVAGTVAPDTPRLVRDRRRYLADVDACRQQLRAGESYEICLTNAAWLPAEHDPFGYYRVLRRLNPAPYAAFLRFGSVAVASSSPERFLKITRDRMAETKPIKGTAPRGTDAGEDERLRAALAADPKTRAENLMIVDLLRNDLGRVCQVGTVTVPSLMATETYATVHQLVSTVRGRLRPEVDCLDAVRACFPGGSMTGAPKLRTLEIIDTLEEEARGVYSGALGYLSCAGTTDLNIVIRTAVFVDGRMHLGAGGAIVLDSDPVAEYDEMLLKMAAPMQAYQQWTAQLRAPDPVRAAVAGQHTSRTPR